MIIETKVVDERMSHRKREPYDVEISTRNIE